MKLFSYFQSFGFTRNEIKVIALLGTTFLLGLAIRYYNSSPLPANTSRKGIDYTVPDSIFEARAKKSTQILPRGISYHDSSEITFLGTQLPKGKSPKSIININTAGRPELMQLPGIGNAYAERIIAYRKEHGPFSTLDELQKVKGIGKKRLEQLKPFATMK
jgi:comEA protein